MAKKLYIKTYGCQMNVYDSARMADTLAPLGYVETDMVDDADMVVINTCHIREKASEKVFSELGRLRRMKETRKSDQDKDLSIAVAGCVAQAEGEEIARRAPWVDVIVGPQAYHTLPELVSKLDPSSRHAVMNTDFPVEDKFDFLPEEHTPRGPAAFLSVQEGCDKFCTFCVVPYTRGAEFSRPVKSIMDEAKRLIASGTVELSLLGQNVNAWHGEAEDGSTWNFGRLLYALAELDGLKRLRYTTSHPLDMHDTLYEAHANIPQLMPYLHLPVQSGSNRILSAMNRRHDRDTYFRIIDRLRDGRPDLALSGDFIVGFPGETDRDFADTLNLINSVNYASAYSFKYSPRPGTPAANEDMQVDEAVKSERLAGLQQVLAAQQRAFNHSKLDQVMDVLIERPASRAGQKAGRSPWMQAVHFNENAGAIGDIIPLKIVSATQNSLAGQPILSV
ncbi:MAG TPA: tRNA (N6-isopentenyl adenosine(37)-C2)-methylthiotransferase MiaB [Alphaproteobacteria bacterium]|nr:tRNA (N6-isopentenyl adenosine(37)-C2)-methylthiotransferase MiaB [Alphaproteobacteria bacterium]|tara:strand:- start:1228 stop:2574 length:1347 start_codon:yes stop_codon:yes gene_type:complete